MILVDAGPLVALFHRDDQNHKACVKTLRGVRDSLVTAWPCVTEAMHLLAFSWEAQDAVWEILVTERLRFLSLDADDAPRMRELMRKYRDLPMDLADAAVVRLGERERIRTVFTTDRRDFSLYRPAGIGRFTIIP